MPKVLCDVRWTSAEHSTLIEDPDLTLRILRHLAPYDSRKPAETTVLELHAAFPENDIPELTHHVVCAAECGLLHAHISRLTAFDWVSIDVTSINCLTARGKDFADDAKTQARHTAIDKLNRAGLRVTTREIVGVFYPEEPSRLPVIPPALIQA